jgi:hypothetical protein
MVLFALYCRIIRVIFANPKFKADLICLIVKPRVNAKIIFSSSVILTGILKMNVY